MPIGSMYIWYILSYRTWILFWTLCNFHGAICSLRVIFLHFYMHMFQLIVEQFHFVPFMNNEGFEPSKHG